MNMEKYRIQRRATGPAYTENFMKDVKRNLDIILEKNINIMKQREGQGTNVDIFFNFFALGEPSLNPRLKDMSELVICEDCLSMLTFSNSKGIVDAGEDDGSVSGIHNAWKYMHLVGFFPWMHSLSTWFINAVLKGWMNKIKALPVFILVKKKGAIEMQENVFGAS